MMAEIDGLKVSSGTPGACAADELRILTSTGGCSIKFWCCQFEFTATFGFHIPRYLLAPDAAAWWNICF